MDRDYFFPQYVPVRERCTEPEFCVTWVRKVSEFRELPTAVKADPPPLTTGLLFGTSEKELADPYNLSEWTGEGRNPDETEQGWSSNIQLCGGSAPCVQVWRLIVFHRVVLANIGCIWSVVTGPRKGDCARHIVRSFGPVERSGGHGW